MPFVNWRYILFTHNDSDEEMDLARRMAAEIGVDRLSWEITDHPENMFSRRFMPGTPEWTRIEHEIWDRSGLGNAIPGATPRAQIEVGAHVVAAIGSAARRSRPGRESRCRSRRGSPTCPRAPFPRTRATAAGWCVSARSCARRTARSSIATTSARGCRHTCRQARPSEIPITLKAPETPGRYRLKFDLVSEGIDWFEQSGSRTTVKDLVVR